MNPPNSAQVKANEPVDLKETTVNKGASCGTCESINNKAEGLQAKELATSSASTKSDSAISSTSSLCSSNKSSSSSSSSSSSLIAEDERASSSGGNPAEIGTQRKSNGVCEQLTDHDGNKPETTPNRCYPKAQSDTEANSNKHSTNINDGDHNFRQQSFQHYQQRAASDQQQLYMGHQQAAVYATPVGCNQVHVPYQGFYSPVGSHYYHQTQQPQSAFYTAISPAHLIRHPAPLFGACIDHVARNRPLFGGSHDSMTRSNCFQQQQYVQTNLAQYKISGQTPEPMQYIPTLNNADKASQQQDFPSDESGSSQNAEVSEETALDDAVTRGKRSRSCDGDCSKTSSSSPSSPATSSGGASRRSSGDDNELANNEIRGDSYQHLSTAQTKLAPSSRSEDDGSDDKQKEEYIDRQNSNDVNEKDEPAGSGDEYFHRDLNGLCQTSNSNEDSSYANSPSTPSSSSSSSSSSPLCTTSLSSSTQTPSSRAPSSPCPSSPSSPPSLICPTGSASLMSHENSAEDKNNSSTYNLPNPQHQPVAAGNSRQPDDLSAGDPDRYTTLAGAPTTSNCRQVAYLQPPPIRDHQQAYYESTLIDLIAEPTAQLVVTNHQPGQHVAAYAIASAQQYMPPAVLFDQQQHHYSCHPAAHLATQHQAAAPILLITSMASGGLQLPPMAVVAQPPMAYHHQSVMGTHYSYPEPVIYSQPTTVRSQQLVPSPTAGPLNIQQQIHYPHEPFAPYYVAPVASASAPTRPYLPTQTNSTANCHHPAGAQQLHSDQIPGYVPFPLIDTGQQQAAPGGLVDRGPPIVSPMVAFSQLKAGYNLISLLPIDAQPACTRQAYGMDKVWHDEFEELFSQLISSIVWTLLEVECNPTLRDSGDIIDYRGRYIVRVDNQEQEPKTGAIKADGATAKTSMAEATSSSDDQKAATSDANEEDDASDSSSDECAGADQSKEEVDKVDLLSAGFESDCDSGAPMNSASCCSETCDNSSHTEPNGDEASRESVGKEETSGKDSKGAQSEANPKEATRRLPTKFRMFIDSAKVRFCCDNCGHGWTSMKGRVVFWYELFELVNSTETSGSGNTLIGYCAYKLFGQQCDVCKIENRFERPMWYPEEVTKVLNNLYNKIGQVYFGFKMPAIDKQRRAGKPKTSHNSSLCQACHDGVCTDRK